MLSTSRLANSIKNKFEEIKKENNLFNQKEGVSEERKKCVFI
jgi:hypothetical protein